MALNVLSQIKGYLHRIDRRCSLRRAVRARPDLLGVFSLYRLLLAAM